MPSRDLKEGDVAMQNFLVIYIDTPESRTRSGWGQLDANEVLARRAQGVRAWNDWAERNKAAIVDPGSPTGKTKRLGPAGLSDGANAIMAYTIVRAESHEAAARLFENHPHFTIFPGEAVEIMPCLPIPAM
jgi:hypothetical protein